MLCNLIGVSGRVACKLKLDKPVTKGMNNCGITPQEFGSVMEEGWMWGRSAAPGLRIPQKPHRYFVLTFLRCSWPTSTTALAVVFSLFPWQFEEVQGNAMATTVSCCCTWACVCVCNMCALFVCICVCVCICVVSVCMHVFMCICVCVCMHMFLLCFCVWLSAHGSVYQCVHVCVCMLCVKVVQKAFCKFILFQM